ncbi:MAG: HIT family protein [Pyrinomonadaceae bacterium]|nr:HIT family protein [Sphingobacteriaceae bacterium]
MPSVFSKIVAGTIPVHKVAEDERFLAFLDVNPLCTGHVLVITKIEVDYIFDLDDDTYLGLNLFAKKVAVGIKKVIPCLRIGVAVVGLEVPHVHIHLVPLNSIDDLNFSRPKLHLLPEELQATALLISGAV